ncbi:MAG TPA: EamA family transporter, partial [Candidatus Caenarcaniphilales bacterium]
MVAMKSVMPQTTPLFLAGVRLVPAGIIVVGAASLLGKPQPRSLAAWIWITLFALVDGTLFQGFLAAGLARTGAGLGSVMIDSQPLAVALLALWLFEEQIGVWGWLGLGLGIGGVSLVGLPDAWFLSLLNSDWLHGKFNVALQLSSENVLPQLLKSGEGLMLLAALSMATGTVMIRKVSRYADP